MSQTIHAQHPAVVLRSHYQQLRALLAIAMIAVVGLTTAVVILASDDGPTSASLARPVDAPAQATSAQRTDGGPEETNVAAAVGSRSEPSPDPGRPDESSLAAAVSGR